MNPDKNRLISIKKAASLLDVHPETLRRWDREGKLRAIKVGVRGDRMYKLSQIERLAYQSKGYVHKRYRILRRSPGFEMFNDRLGLVASFVVKRDDGEMYGFAFAVDGLASFASPNTEPDYDELAFSAIKRSLDQGNLKSGEEYTYEYLNGEFVYVKDPVWWVKGGL